MWDRGIFISLLHFFLKVVLGLLDKFRLIIMEEETLFKCMEHVFFVVSFVCCLFEDEPQLISQSCMVNMEG